MQTEIKNKLENILENVGDMGFKRRVFCIFDYLDIQANDVVLDCGCGEGFYTMVMNELFECKITALDADEKLLNMAKDRVGNSTKVEFVKMDAQNLPFPDNSFDKIIFTEVLEHIPDEISALKELYRILKPGGVVALTVPSHNYPFLWDPLNKIREGLGLGHFKMDLLGGIWHMHIRLYYPEDLKQIIQKAGFKIDDSKGILHYCLPFNQNILRFFKLFYTSIPMPEAITSSMEKFDWKETIKKKQPWWNPIPLAKKILLWVDKKNDRLGNIENSSLCIAVKMRKI